MNDLRRELEPHLSFQINELRELPVLNGIILETLRIHPPVLGNFPRFTSPAGLSMAGRFVPGSVNISVPQYAIMRDPRYWSPEPNSWRPERWIDPSKEEAMDARACQFSGSFQQMTS